MIKKGFNASRSSIRPLLQNRALYFIIYVVIFNVSHDFTEINYIYNHGNRIPNIHDVNFLNCKRKLYVSASICKTTMSKIAY